MYTIQDRLSKEIQEIKDSGLYKNELHGISIVKTENEITYVKSAAGEVWHNFVLFCIENNLGGVENLSLIPGSVGAAPPCRRCRRTR